MSSFIVVFVNMRDILYSTPYFLKVECFFHAFFYNLDKYYVDL